MKKIILKTTALLIALAGLFASCSLFEDDDDDSPIGLIVAPAFNKAVLSLSVAGEGAARTALPSVSSAQEFESFDFEANNGAASITKSWTGGSEKTAYAKMTSESFEIDAGTWTFTLTAKKGGMTYKGSVEKEITAGANSIEFTLSLSELSNEGKGSVEIKLSVPQNVIAVTATLCDTSENEVSDSNITQSTNLSNNTVSYSAQNVPSGTYLVLFNLYADTSKTLLLGKWREYAGITSDATSKSEIAIAEDDLDKVYTITYELNWGTLKGNWSGNYTRHNLDIQIPDATSVIKNCKVFDGWYCDEAFTKLFCIDNLKEGNITLYAKWRNYKASEVAPAINNGTLTGTQSEPANLVLEGEITSEQLNDVSSAMESKQCYLSLDLSETTGLSSVGNEFKNCTHLTGISIPKTVTSIVEGAFSGCSGLTEMTIPFVGESVSATGKSSLFGYIFGTSSYTDGTATQMYYSSSSSATYYIPSSLKTVTVLSGGMKYGAFYGCRGLKNVTIPSNVTSIGIGAFYGCSGLESVTIPSSVTNIEAAAFNGCRGLKSVTIQEGVTSIGDDVFGECSGLTSVTIPSSVTSIGKHAFAGCSVLKSVVIPGSVTSIGGQAFEMCSGLESVTIPGSVTYIEKETFKGCSGLKSVKIQEGVTSIGDWAFKGCSGLESVTIPSSVTRIWYEAFDGCRGLTNVYYRGTESQWGRITIGSSNDKLTNATKTYNYTGE